MDGKDSGKLSVHEIYILVPTIYFHIHAFMHLYYNVLTTDQMINHILHEISVQCSPLGISK